MKRKIVIFVLLAIIFGLVLGSMHTNLDTVDHFKIGETKLRLALFQAKFGSNCEKPEMRLAELVSEDTIHGKGIDSWGKQIELRRRDNGSLELTSGGPDKTIGTKDDIVMGVNCKKS